MEDCAGICGGDAEEDNCGVCNGDGEIVCWDGSVTCDFSNCPTETQHFTNLPELAGFTNLIVLSNMMALGLEPGDEIGLFDNSGLLSDDCSDNIGEILVGAGVYTGDQLEILSIGSVDLCDLDGGQHPGL